MYLLFLFPFFMFIVGRECNEIKNENDTKIESGKYLIKTAKKAFFTADNHLIVKWLQKYVNEFLCNEENEFGKNYSKIGNFVFYEKSEKMRKTFCGQIIEGKGIENATEKVGKMAIKLAKELENDKTIKENIQNALKNKKEKFIFKFSNAIELTDQITKNYTQENLEKLKTTFYLELARFLKSFKASKIENFCQNQQIALAPRRHRRFGFRAQINTMLNQIRHPNWLCVVLFILCYLSISAFFLMIYWVNANHSCQVCWTFLCLSFVIFMAFFAIFTFKCSSDAGNTTNNTPNDVEMDVLQA